MTTERNIRLTVNGKAYESLVPVRMTLVDFLRGELDLTGTHVGCEHGVCGACTILVDGSAMRSCLMLAVQAGGKTIETVESLATDETLSPLQAAFHRNFALQCGFCTPGIAIAAAALLESNPAPSREDMNEAIPNICRCGVYPRLARAIPRAAESASGAAAIEAAPPPSVSPEEAARDVPALRPEAARTE